MDNKRVIGQKLKAKFWSLYSAKNGGLSSSLLFLSGDTIKCPFCNGTRINKEVSDYLKDKLSIIDILNASIAGGIISKIL